jgi:GntR family transcriptional regulator
MNRLALQVSVVSGVPIYRQLMEQVRTLVAGKRLRAGEFLPSVRAVAEELSGCA